MSNFAKLQFIVLEYSGHAMWFGPVLGQHLWQLSRLARKHNAIWNVNATYLLFILEGIKIAKIAWVNVGPCFHAIMTVVSCLRFLYIYGWSGLLCDGPSAPAPPNVCVCRHRFCDLYRVVSFTPARLSLSIDVEEVGKQTEPTLLF